MNRGQISAIVVVVILGVLAGVGLMLYSRQKELGIAIPTPQSSTEPESSLGAIQGSLSYPSETIPTDMQVCAETLQKEQVKCTSEHIQIPKAQGTGVGYLLEVPAGSYFVYAILPDNPEQKAYYSEFVTCGLLASCDSHEPIPVSVTAGGSATEVNPHDWYVTP